MSLPRPHKKKPADSRKPSNQLRIIGGKWRGRKLHFASVDGLRPTGDRIRETLFNWLMGHLPDSRCLDLFGGSGALGLEALSRGAAFTTIVEQNREAAAQIRQNLELLSCENAELIHTDALNLLLTPPVEPYDIVFIDPPFSKNLWPEVILRLSQNNWLAEEALIYLESPKGVSIPTPAHWSVYKQKPIGGVVFQLFRIN